MKNIRIVLLGTTHPANIGGAARAMKNMSLETLYLVSPRHFPHADATARASGADDILAGARVCATLDEALAGCRLVVGATARTREIAWPQLTPRECAQLLVAEAEHAPVALVFGPERCGLSNADTDRCHYLASIPANAAHSSLNLACAVQVFAYEIFLAHAADAHAPGAGAPAADAEQMRRFYAHLQETLVAIEFLNPAYPRKLMRKIIRLFNRARPSVEELNILRGALTAVQAQTRRLLDRDSRQLSNDD